MSLRIKLVLMFLSIAIIPLLFVNAIIFHNYKDSIQKSRVRALQDIAVYKSDKIEDFFADMKRFLAIAQGAYVVKQKLPVLIRLSANPEDLEFIAAKEMINAPLQNMQSAIGLVDIMLLSPEGKIVYSSNLEHQFRDFGKILPDANRETFEEGSKSIHFSDIFINKMNRNRPGMLFTGPVFDASRNFIGEVAFEADIELIYKLIMNQTGLGNTGETLLVKREGDDVLFLNSLRFEPSAALNKKIRIGSGIGIPAQEAVKGKNGAGISIDYRGREVIAAWRNICATGWGIVAKIDSKEAFADVSNLEKLVWIVLLIVSFLAGIMAFSVAKSISDPIRKLSEGAEMIGGGNLDFKVGTVHNDEVGQLSRAFDKMVLDLKATMASRDELNREVAERRQVEDALRESENKYRRLFETMTEGIVYQDQDGKIIDMNPAAERILGKSMEEFIGQTSESTESDCIHEDGEIYLGHEHPAMVALRSGQIVRNAIMGVFNPMEKMRRWIEITAVPLFSPDGGDRPHQVYTVFSDVTSRKRFEDALRDSEFFLSETQRIAHLAGWKANPYSDMLEWSDNVYEIVEAPRGYKPGLEEGLKFYLPEYIPAIREKIIRCMTNGERFTMECRVRTTSGKILWAELRGISRVVKGGSSYVLGTFQDITERKQAEEVIRRSVGELQAANNELERFNKAMIDRELRMVELKKQVNELCVKMGQPAPYHVEESKGS